MAGTESPMTIGTLADVAGVNVETIRYYQRRGLLREPVRPRGSVRRYGQRDVERVRFIMSAKELGFSLDEIGYLLKLDDGMHCSDAARLAERHLADVREKLRLLRGMEAALSDLVDACRRTPGDVACPLIEALHEGRRQ